MVGIQHLLLPSATSSPYRTGQGFHHTGNKTHHCVPVSPECWETYGGVYRIPLRPDVKSISDETLHAEPTWYFAQHFPVVPAPSDRKSMTINTRQQENCPSLPVPDIVPAIIYQL